MDYTTIINGFTDFFIKILGISTEASTVTLGLLVDILVIGTSLKLTNSIPIALGTALLSTSILYLVGFMAPGAIILIEIVATLVFMALMLKVSKNS